MKKTYLIYSLVLLNVSLACSQKENHSPIEDSNKDLYSLEKIVDGIDIPWGMSFTSTNSFLVTDKKGILNLFRLSIFVLFLYLNCIIIKLI